MEKLRRFFYENKRDIFKIIGIVAIILIFIQLLNQVAKRKNAEQENAKRSVDYGRDISEVSNEKKSSKLYERETSLLKTFTDYCNMKYYEEAYSLLSDECKEALYPTVERFKYDYCDLNFTNPKTCGFQVWSGDTYKVEIRDDIMSSGKYIKEKYAEDFYTIKNGKLNIAKLIERIKFENTQSEGTFKVRIDTMDIFKDYTIINISAINQSKKTAILDPMLSDRNIYITDNNRVNYYFSVSELSKEDVTVKPGQAKQIPLKFYTTSREGLKLETLTIKKMIENLDNYEQGLNYSYTEANLEL